MCWICESCTNTREIERLRETDRYAYIDERFVGSVIKKHLDALIAAIQ